MGCLTTFKCGDTAEKLKAIFIGQKLLAEDLNLEPSG
jgi:hypothetical protein